MKRSQAVLLIKTTRIIIQINFKGQPALLAQHDVSHMHLRWTAEYKDLIVLPKTTLFFFFFSLFFSHFFFLVSLSVKILSFKYMKVSVYSFTADL